MRPILTLPSAPPNDWEMNSRYRLVGPISNYRDFVGLVGSRWYTVSVPTTSTYGFLCREVTFSNSERINYHKILHR